MAGASDSGGLQLVASQSVANATLIPASLGWSIQLVLCGVSVDRARRILGHRKYHEARNSGVPGTRIFLLLATMVNIVYTIIIIWDTTVWQVNQNRTDDGLNSLLLPDVIGSSLAGVVGVIVPIFMAIRCWRIAGKSRLFAAVITLLMATVLGCLIWSSYMTYRYHVGTCSGDDLFLPTMIWLVTSAATDALITLFLATHLKRLKRGFISSTDTFLDALVRLAFETSAPPAAASTAAAIVYACTWQDTYAWNSYYGIVPFIPSLYLLSFVFCLQGTRRHGRILAQPSQNNMTEVLNGHRKVSSAGMMVTETFADSSWRPPIDWHSTIGSNSDDIQGFHEGGAQETPFATYITAEYPFAADGHREVPVVVVDEENIKQVFPAPLKGLKLTKETEIQFEEIEGSSATNDDSKLSSS